MDLRELQKSDLLLLCEELGIDTKGLARKPIIIQAINDLGADDEELSEEWDLIIERKLRAAQMEGKSEHEKLGLKRKFFNQDYELSMRLGPQRGVLLLDNEAEFEMSRYMQPYEVSWDMGLYLRLFERKCSQLKCERDTWSQRLRTVLPCEAADVVARLSEQHANNYEVVKAELIRRFGTSISKKKERLAPESESEARRKAPEVEAPGKALETDIAPEKGPRILEGIDVEHAENEALAGLEVGTMSKDAPCVDEEGASSPDGPSKRLETFFMPQEDLWTLSKVGMVSAVADESKNAMLQQCSPIIEVICEHRRKRKKRRRSSLRKPRSGPTPSQQRKGRPLIRLRKRQWWRSGRPKRRARFGGGKEGASPQGKARFSSTTSGKRPCPKGQSRKDRVAKYRAGVNTKRKWHRLPPSYWRHFQIPEGNRPKWKMRRDGSALLRVCAFSSLRPAGKQPGQRPHRVRLKEPREKGVVRLSNTCLFRMVT
ncbi:uncharacterized protein LOC142818056 isoform X1 [Rhipicephalus microplus]|uniref:uncharacterized protein LOC142818056 isoform X1 n=1 Tax=Rhipicephalus microplus TaxID=6941 RepID=UPI003F6BE13D